MGTAESSSHGEESIIHSSPSLLKARVWAHLILVSTGKEGARHHVRIIKYLPTKSNKLKNDESIFGVAFAFKTASILLGITLAQFFFGW